jgi:hypothetical protein
MPKYRIGDILWVKETWHYCPHKEEVLYKATDEGTGRDFRVGSHGGWKSPRFMPKANSRITLEITDIRVERLQDISEEDTDAEVFGGEYPHVTLPEMFSLGDSYMTVQECFGIYWNSLNAKRGYSWESNPWVWAISFKVVK